MRQTDSDKTNNNNNDDFHFFLDAVGKQIIGKWWKTIGFLLHLAEWQLENTACDEKSIIM